MPRKLPSDDPENIVIHPRRGRREKEICPGGLLLVNPYEATYGIEVLIKGGAEQQFLFNSGLVVDYDRGSFVAGPAIGAPVAVMALEKLIALGARKIVLFGWCGAVATSLQVGDLLLPVSGLRGEGTSGYYTDEEVVTPSGTLVELLRENVAHHGYSVAEGRVWSTDAPYREKRDELDELNRMADVVAVDMEFSALCAAASFRQVEFAALFLVSDELYGKEWKPGFTQKSFRNTSRALIDMLLDIQL